MEIYQRIEARLMQLEKLIGELEHKLKALDELAKLVDELERKLERLRWREIG